jgi:hypothetical protein
MRVLQILILGLLLSVGHSEEGQSVTDPSAADPMDAGGNEEALQPDNVLLDEGGVAWAWGDWSYPVMGERTSEPAGPNIVWIFRSVPDGYRDAIKERYGCEVSSGEAYLLNQEKKSLEFLRSVEVLGETRTAISSQFGFNEIPTRFHGPVPSWTGWTQSFSGLQDLTNQLSAKGEL